MLDHGLLFLTAADRRSCSHMTVMDSGPYPWFLQRTNKHSGGWQLVTAQLLTAQLLLVLSACTASVNSLTPPTTFHWHKRHKRSATNWMTLGDHCKTRLPYLSYTHQYASSTAPVRPRRTSMSITGPAQACTGAASEQGRACRNIQNRHPARRPFFMLHHLASETGVQLLLSVSGELFMDTLNWCRSGAEMVKDMVMDLWWL